jgi:putative ABC transport system permease protein
MANKKNKYMLIISDLKSAVRSIFRNRVPSAISILGLGIGLGCIIALMALIVHEKSFDKFIPEHKSLYRLVFGNNGHTSYPLSETMAGEFSEVKDYFRFYQINFVQIRNSDNEMVKAEDFSFADPSIFRIMGIDFISGVPAGSVREIAISDEISMKFFGNLSPVGSILPVKFSDGIAELTVTGVYKSFPENSILYPDFIADIKLSEKMFIQFQMSLGEYGTGKPIEFDWSRNEFVSFVVLQKNADPAAVAAKMDKYKEFLGNPDKEKLEFRLQPVADIYLGSGEISASQYLRRGNPEELGYYEAIAFLILFISIANYILLSRAVVSDRGHELGVRKVFGASHGMLRRLVFTESVIIVLLSLIPATFVVDYGIPFINSTLNKTMTGHVFLSPLLWLLLIVVVGFSGTISGWLISINFSRMPALKLISGKKLRPEKSNRWNYSFLVLHFTIYVMLVAGVIAVSKQLKYSISGNKGFNPENILITSLSTEKLQSSFLTISDELKKIPGVINCAGGSYIPPLGYQLPINLAVAEGQKERFDGLIMGEGMVELLGVEVIEGSSFGQYKPGLPEILINETAAKKHKVEAGDKILVFSVRGIVKDFVAHSAHEPVQPMVILQQNPAKMAVIAIKTDGKNDEAVINRMKELYSQISPDELFEMEYLTDQYDLFYARERNQLRIIGVFSLLAAILSVMGLFGISLISISKRRKEIGIRKVNGASIAEVLFMLNTDFVKWVLVSVIISIPASVWLISLWLDRFAYKSGLSWWIFASAAFSAVLIAVLTVSWQSWRAATRNPVEALRYE